MNAQPNNLLMKRILLFFFTCLCISNSYAQTNARDSLKQLLNKEKTDTGRVLLLAELAYQIHESKPDSAMNFAVEALSIARTIGYKKGEAVSLNRIGNVWNVLGNYPQAMEAFLKALKINENINNLDGIRRNYNNIGLIYRIQGDFQQALNYLLKAKELGVRLNDKEALSITLVNIGANYLDLKKIDSASLYALQGYHIALQINYARQIGGALVVLGRINAASGQPALALEYYRLSIFYSTKAENFSDLCFSHLGMAKLFDLTKQQDSVLFYAKQSLLIAAQKGFTIHVRDAGRFLTAFYRSRNMPDSALFYVDVTKIANDSLFGQQKNRQLQSLDFDEKLRQQEIAAGAIKNQQERKNNLQYAAIVIGLISFIILFFVLGRSIIVKEKFIKFFGIVGLLAVFEFINLYIHPYLDKWTNHSPFLMLAILICVGALLVPLHHKLEKWITKIMVEKNKKIRLEAARKTIEQLEVKN